MPKIVFFDSDGVAHEVEGRAGQSLMDIAVAGGIDMEAACEGVMACSTCHVIVDEKWFGKLAEPSEDEEDMLDLASGLAPTSRLACQIEVTQDMDGLTVRLPTRVNNLLLV